MVTAWKADPARIVRSPPMRSASAPQAWRARKAASQHHRQHDGAAGRADADVAAEGDEMCLGHRHGNAAAEAREAEQRLRRRWDAGRRRDCGASPPPRSGAAAPAAIGAGRSSKVTGRIDDQHDAGKSQHGGLPAEFGDAALEHRRPDDAGDILAGRDQGDRRAAPAVEPAADIDQERRIDAAVAQESDHQPLADIEGPDRAERRTGPGRRRSCRRRWQRWCAAPMRSASQPIRIPPAPVPIQTRAPASASDRTVGPQRLLHRLHADDDQQRRAEGDRQHGQRHPGRPPRGAAFDAAMPRGTCAGCGLGHSPSCSFLSHF